MTQMTGMMDAMSRKITIAAFKKTIWAHYYRAGRGTMPWRHTRDPYAIFISEIMLQQTQAARVEKYYEAFVRRFPTFRALADAKTGDLLKAWQGLGYNRRAIFLKRAAEVVIEAHGGRLPRDRATLKSLPGIGRGTSGSLMAFVFNQPEIFIETNIRRVFIHFFFPKRKKVTDLELERYIARSMDKANPRKWYWALMDYGAAMPGSRIAAKAPNPNRRSAHYKKQSAFAGSDRELRGKIIRSTLSRKGDSITATALIAIVGAPRKKFDVVVASLEKEGFIVRKGKYICIKR